jgi:hypothetical protein
MTTVMGAIDASAAATPVLNVSNGLAELIGAEATAFHVREAGFTPVRAAAQAAGLRLEVGDGPVAETLARVAARPEVGVVVIGARSALAGRRPAGRIALRLITAVSKPSVVVPPSTSDGRIRRIVVALEGASRSADAVARVLAGARDRGVEVILAHVHELGRLPPFEEQPHHDLEAWTGEFIARWCPPGAAGRHVELRIGAPGRRLVEAAQAADADLIALSWSRNLAPGPRRRGPAGDRRKPDSDPADAGETARAGPRGLRVATNPHPPAANPG